MKYDIRKMAYENIKNKPIGKMNPEYLQQVKDGFCPTCGKRLTGFRDELSRKEYIVSGICQQCQDSIFE